MKIAIYIIAILATIGIPTLLHTADNKISDKSISAPVEVCPVVGKPEDNFNFSEYTHCAHCGIGVYLPNEINVVRCTHCYIKSKQESHLEKK